MAYETDTASDIQDLVDKLFTFLAGSTAAWTVDEHVDASQGYGTVHKDGIYASFRWDTATANDLAVYQSLGWTASVLPHQQTGDSGNGDSTLPIDADRRVNFQSAGPYTAYHFFASDSAPFYCYVAVEVDSGRFRHFGFGEINKIGDWVGGEFCYGHFWNQGSTPIDQPANGSHSFLLDNALTSAQLAATMHIEGLTDMDPTTDWGVFGDISSMGNDRGGNPRVRLMGSARGGLWNSYLSWIHTSALNAFKPLTPMQVTWEDRTVTPEKWVILGEIPDMAIVNMKNLNPGDEIIIGSDTWVVFPWVRKQFLQANTEESWNAGVAYKKIL